ncbi:aminoglycoside phosphotransferase family protein [Anaeromicropila populeti]|uniref:Predicted kinase, aminoglycoside phosphotransferase (APT) family n=1 Tax=Anaeromicropila populeti TaxID=37658 RepID=A0A1I6ICP9_9FIRM|nr:phosphotransferase [Anaeromicropila populeti]SFR64555.1 Predicted kinase, aminoglycoside phosphotransferase (APT) family [Anaeromicropila populeti]
MNLFQDIKLSSGWKVINPIEKGWSEDAKYYVESADGKKLLLRISDISKMEKKEKEFEVINKYAQLGIEMSQPIEFGICNNRKSVYMLLTWVEGVDLEQALPELSKKEQYALGRMAGEILKKIHSIKVMPYDLPSTTKVQKKLKQLEAYVSSDIRIEEDKSVIQYIEQNINKMWSVLPVYQHGDFHPGNLILTPDKRIGVIDFNRWEVGDPYEEFYKLESFGTEVSIPYCIGQIDAYFNDNVPDLFWEVLAVYVAHAALYSIKWAEKFGQNDVKHMVCICKRIFAHYDKFKLLKPVWYTKYN